MQESQKYDYEEEMEDDYEDEPDTRSRPTPDIEWNRDSDEEDSFVTPEVPRPALARPLLDTPLSSFLSSDASHGGGDPTTQLSPSDDHDEFHRLTMEKLEQNRARNYENMEPWLTSGNPNSSIPQNSASSALLFDQLMTTEAGYSSSGSSPKAEVETGFNFGISDHTKALANDLFATVKSSAQSARQGARNVFDELIGQVENGDDLSVREAARDATKNYLKDSGNQLFDDTVDLLPEDRQLWVRAHRAIVPGKEAQDSLLRNHVLRPLDRFRQEATANQ